MRAPAPADENPDSTPMGNASHGSHRAFFTANRGFCTRGKNEMLDETVSSKPRRIVTTPLFSVFAAPRRASMTLRTNGRRSFGRGQDRPGCLPSPKVFAVVDMMPQ